MWREVTAAQVLKQRRGLAALKVAPALEGLREALHAGHAYLHLVDHEDGRKDRLWSAPARWVRAVHDLRGEGVRVLILDATASDEVCTSLWTRQPTRVHVADAPNVDREWVYTSGARSEKLNARDAARWVQQIADRAHARGGKHVGLITKRAWRDRLHRLLRAALPDVKVSVGHFGGLRGLDTLQDVDLLAVVGEQWHGLGDVAGEAAVVGADAKVRWRQRTEEELAQAEGRLRPVHRRTPALLLRFTATRPNLQMAPQWRAASHPGVTALPGCVERIDPKSSSSLRAAKLKLDLSEQELALLAGISRGSLRRRLADQGDPAPLDLTGIGSRQNPQGSQASTTLEGGQALGARTAAPSPRDGDGHPRLTSEKSNAPTALGMEVPGWIETVETLFRLGRETWSATFTKVEVVL